MTSDRTRRANFHTSYDPGGPSKTPREESGLPAPKFTDAECAAYVWLIHRGIRPWTVDLLGKGVQDGPGNRWPGLIQFAEHHGWEGMK